MKQETLKGNLLYQRKLKGYSQEELSDKSTVAVRTIQRIEKGDVQPHLQTVKLLAAGLEIEVEDLIVLDDPNEEVVKRKWMMLLHGGPFLGLIVPFANILFPLFLWIHKADRQKRGLPYAQSVTSDVGFSKVRIVSFFLMFDSN